MPKLKFTDLKTKKPFITDKFKLGKTKNGRKFAMTTAPSGVKATRFVSKDFKI